MRDQWISEFEWLQSNYPDFPSPEIEARVTSSAFSALFLHQPSHPQFAQWKERIRILISGAAPVPQKMMIGSLLARHYMFNGEYSKAKWVFTTLKPVLAQKGVDAPLDRIILLEAEALLCWLEAEYERTLELVAKALDLAQTSLFLKALQNGIEVDYVQSLIRKQKSNLGQPPQDCDLWPWPVEINTLGRFSES